MPIVVDLLAPSSVVDFGCGVGAWLSVFQRLGCSVIGLEGGSPGESQMLVNPSLIRRADLELPVDLGQRFDLAVTVEVAEHLPVDCADTFLDTLTRHAEAVLFSAAIPGQGGYYHLNEQWPGYWAELFSERGFECFDAIRDRIWFDERVMWWHRQNILIFACGSVADRLRERGITSAPPRHLVHPDLFEGMLVALRAQGVRAHARGLVRALVNRSRRGPVTPTGSAPASGERAQRPSDHLGDGG